MRYLLRHLLAVAVLPFSVTVLIPIWLARRNGITLTIGTSPAAAMVQAAGLVLLAAGLVLFAASLRRFFGEGRGTLAPWDPPRQLVVRGVYRHVRNPMISGVVLVLFGESMALLSRPHLIWALTFLGLNLIYIPLIEEPMLAERFGQPYRDYCRNVPRLLPRLRAWSGGGKTDDAA